MGAININFEDGAIVIRAGAHRYADTLAHFELDAQQALPALPAGVVSLRYDQADGRLIVSTGADQEERKAAALKSKLDWAIAAAESLIARKDARAPAPDAPPPASLAARLAEIEARLMALEAKINTN